MNKPKYAIESLTKGRNQRYGASSSIAIKSSDKSPVCVAPNGVIFRFKSSNPRITEVKRWLRGE